LGNVKEETVEANGSQDSMISDSAHLNLLPPDATPKVPATQSAEADIGGRKLKDLTLLGNIHGMSVLKGADNAIVRRGELWGSKLTYDAVTGRAQVPGAGHLLMENHKTANDKAPPADSAFGSNYGNLVMQWTDGLTYSPPDKTVVFDGNVDTWFQQDVKDAGLMKLKSQNVIAFLEPVVSTRPSNAKAGTSKMQLSHVTANGSLADQLNFNAKSIDFDADSIDYDPKTSLMTATGTDQRPAQLNDKDGSKRSFRELIFNMKSQIVESAKGLKGDLRK
jgi:hypothetical protein